MYKRQDLSLANRNADAVAEYYRADTEGEAFYRMVAGEVKAACAGAAGQEERLALLKTSLGEYLKMCIRDSFWKRRGM